MIDLTKKYRTRQGEEIIYSVFDEVRGAIVSIFRDSSRGNQLGTLVTYRDGIYSGSGNQSRYDMIEIRPYDHIKIDDKVYVSDTAPITKHTKSARGHFYGMIEGLPTIFSEGKTSFTSSIAYGYKYCVLASEIDNA